MNKALELFGAIILIILVTVVILGIGSLVTMIAWNIVMPAIFGLPKLTIWMAFGINILLGLIKPVFNFSQTKTKK